MGVYIPTMIMPSDCDYCDLYQRGYCGAKGARVQCEEGVDADCPLVEVKTPHGRLIDASTKVTVPLYDDMYEEWTEQTMLVEDYLMWADESVPTVIESEAEVE